MADLWLAIVMSSAVCGFCGYVYASKTGRNLGLWTTLGVLLNILGFVLYQRGATGQKSSVYQKLN